MSQEEQNIALAEIEDAQKHAIPTLSEVIDELSETLHESISELVDYSIPEISCTSQYRKSKQAPQGHERWQISIRFGYGYSHENETTLFARENTLPECVETIHHQIAELLAHLKTSLHENK